MCAMMQKFRMNFGSIFLAYQFSRLRAGCEWPARLFSGSAAIERATHAACLPQAGAKKPCRMNNQSATSPSNRQQSTHERALVSGKERIRMIWLGRLLKKGDAIFEG